MDKKNFINKAITGGTAMNYAEEIINNGVVAKETATTKTDLSVTMVVTDKVALFSSHLFEAWAYEPPIDKRVIKPEPPKRKPKYSTGIIIPKESPTVRKVEIGIKKAIKIGRPIFGGEIPDPSLLRLPLKDGDKEWVTNLMLKDSYYLYASSDFKPEVVDKNGATVFPYEIRDGIYARVSILFSPYNVNGQMGVSCILNNVQILKGTYSPHWSTAKEDFSL